MKKGLLLFLLCFCSLFYWLYGIQQVKQEVAVRLVLVDVIATKDGEFVKDLTVEDFEVKEDGKKIPINSFELISFEKRECHCECYGQYVESRAGYFLNKNR